MIAKRLKLSLAIPVASALLLAAGCGSSSGGGTTGTADSSGAPTSASQSGGQVTYWSMYTEDEPAAKVYQALIKDFEAETGTKVDVQWQGREVVNKVVAAASTGDVPDLVDQSDDLLGGLLAANGQTLDLADLYKREIPGEAGTTLASLLGDKYDAITKRDGAYFMVPHNVQPITMWYDGNKHPNIAKNPPETWDQFTSLLADLKAAGTSPLALDGDIIDYDRYWVATALTRSTGNRLLEVVEDKTGAAWDAPDVRQGVEAVAGLVNSGSFIDGWNGSKWPAIQTKWAAGDAAFLLLGAWVPNETSSYAAEGMQYRAIKFPKIGDSGDYSLPMRANGFVVLKNGKNVDGAQNLLLHLFKKSSMQKFTEEANNMVVRADVTPTKDFTDLTAILADSTISIQNGGVSGKYSTYDTTIFQPLSGELMTGQIDADQFLSKIKEQQIQYWKLNG